MGCGRSRALEAREVTEARPAGAGLGAQGGLAEYFLGGYLRGELFEGAGYARRLDEELRLPVLEHARTGIRIWSEALDLRSVAHQSVVLFRYTTPEVLVKLAGAGRTEADIFAGLADETEQFGKGTLMCAKEPGLFASREEVLLNIVWPRAGDPAAQGDSEVRMLLAGGPEAGPDDPRNEAVRRALLGSRRHARSVDCCLAVLVPRHLAYGLWEKRRPPDLAALGVGSGCDRWGHRHWPGRDVCLVTLQGADLERARGSEARLGVARARVARLERLMGTAHPDTLAALVGLAALQTPRGTQQTEQLMRRALKGYVEKLGVEHPSSLFCASLLATILVELARDMEGKQGHVEADNGKSEALLLLQHVHRSRRAALGAGSASTIAALEDVAELLRELGRHHEAHQLCREAGQARQEMQRSEAEPIPLCGDPEGKAGAVGDGHPDALASMQELAELLTAKGRQDGAERLLRSVLERREAALGELHPDTLSSAGDLAALLRASGRPLEAEPLCRRVLQGRQASAGSRHPETLAAQADLAGALRDAGKVEEAERHLRGALDGNEKTLGPTHPDTLASQHSLALLLEAAGKLEEAERLYRLSLAGRESALGPTHPATLTSLNNLGVLCLSTNRHGEAEKCCRRALDGLEATLGPTHPSTLQSLHNMAVLVSAMGRTREADQLLHRAVQGCTLLASAGEHHEEGRKGKHADTVTAVANLARALKAMGGPDGASGLHKQVGRQPSEDSVISAPPRGDGEASGAGRPPRALSPRMWGRALAAPVEVEWAPPRPNRPLAPQGSGASRRDPLGEEELLMRNLTSSGAGKGGSHPETLAAAGDLTLSLATLDSIDHPSGDKEAANVTRVAIHGTCWNKPTTMELDQIGSNEVRGTGRNANGMFTVKGTRTLQQSMYLIITNGHGDWKLHLSSDGRGGYSGRYQDKDGGWHDAVLEMTKAEMEPGRPETAGTHAELAKLLLGRSSGAEPGAKSAKSQEPGRAKSQEPTSATPRAGAESPGAWRGPPHPDARPVWVPPAALAPPAGRSLEPRPAATAAPQAASAPPARRPPEPRRAATAARAARLAKPAGRQRLVRL